MCVYMVVNYILLRKYLYEFFRDELLLSFNYNEMHTLIGF